jgi:hypothetical protein
VTFSRNEIVVDGVGKEKRRARWQRTGGGHAVLASTFSIWGLHYFAFCGLVAGVKVSVISSLYLSDIRNQASVPAKAKHGALVLTRTEYGPGAYAFRCHRL